MTNTTTASPSRTPLVGDILVSSWGYEQTNIDFYRVTKVTKASVSVVLLSSVSNRSDWGGGTKTPGTESIGSVKTHRFNLRKTWDGKESYSIKLNSYSYASLWDGTAQRFTDNY
jgi:hypothetical protein